jgi:putative acyl-CoA dehydrogenase
VRTSASRPANQPPALAGYDLFSQDRALAEALRREGGEAHEAACARFGQLCGGDVLELGRLANEHPPTLRGDEVEFHPAWHELLRIGVEHGLHAAPWAEDATGAHVARATRFMTLAYVEAGVGCPLSMTYAAVPALRSEAALAAAWEPRLVSRAYEPGLRPLGEKAAALAGMTLTERQGGSDVRANETRA